MCVLCERLGFSFDVNNNISALIFSFSAVFDCSVWCLCVSVCVCVCVCVCVSVCPLSLLSLCVCVFVLCCGGMCV